MCVFRYVVIVNLVVEKRLDMAGVMFSICLSGKCGCGEFIYVRLVIELIFQLFMKWYVLLVVWRGRLAEAILFLGVTLSVRGVIMFIGMIRVLVLW